MIYLATVLIIVAVALYIAGPLAPGTGASHAHGALRLSLDGLEHDRAQAVQGLRELELDHEMGKVSDEDYQGLRSRLESRALEAMEEIEKIRRQDGYPTLGRAVRGQPEIRFAGHPRAPSSHQRFCAQCGQRTAPEARFCCECGAALPPLSRLVERSG